MEVLLGLLVAIAGIIIKVYESREKTKKKGVTENRPSQTPVPVFRWPRLSELAGTFQEPETAEEEQPVFTEGLSFEGSAGSEGSQGFEGLSVAPPAAWHTEGEAMEGAPVAPLPVAPPPKPNKAAPASPAPPVLAFTPENLRQAVIYSEILGPRKGGRKR